jgi:hypothetical protein
MWREIRELSALKPVVASQVDVAASGGYYISMACDQIVAEELTITGSIGVVLSKFNTKNLSAKLGVGVENISRGRYAEVIYSAMVHNYTTLISSLYDTMISCWQHQEDLLRRNRSTSLTLLPKRTRISLRKQPLAET